MEAMIEFAFAGLKKFTGEIIGAVMVTALLWMFPGFRKIFSYRSKNPDSRLHEEIQKEDEKLSRLKYELKRNEEALECTESKTAEEIRKRTEIQKQLYEKHREEERIKAEIQRQQELLRQAEAKKAEEERLRKEAQRQLDDIQKSQRQQNKPHIKLTMRKLYLQ